MSSNLSIISLNTGGFSHLLDENLILRDEVVTLIEDGKAFSANLILCLQEMRMQPQKNDHLHLRAALEQLGLKEVFLTRPNNTQPRRDGAKDWGTGMYTNITGWKSLQKYAGMVAIQLPEEGGKRLVIATVYWQFGLKILEPIQYHLRYVQQQRELQNEVILIGDLNTQRRVKHVAEFPLASLGMRRIWQEHQTTGVSKIGEGIAQGAFTTKTDVSLYTLTRPAFRVLSDHHVPVLLYVPAIRRKQEVKPRDPLIFSMRKPLPAYTEKIEGCTSFAELKMEMIRNTIAPKSFTTNDIFERARRGLEDKLSSQDFATRKKAQKQLRSIVMKRIQNVPVQLYTKERRNMRKAPRIVLVEKMGPMEEMEPIAGANQMFAEGLQQRWGEKTIIETAVKRILQEIRELPVETVVELTKEVTLKECVEGLETLKHKRATTDYTVTTLNQMGPKAMTILAKQFTQWMRGPPQKSQVVIGLRKPGTEEPPARQNEQALRAWIMASMRPIGISEVIWALYQVVLHKKLRQAFRGQHDDAQCGFIEGKSPHTIVLPLLFRIDEAQRAYQPMIVVTADLEKAYCNTQTYCMRKLGEKLGISQVMESTITGILNTNIEVRVNGEKAVVISQKGGFSQGEATVTDYFPFFTDPAAKKCGEKIKEYDHFGTYCSFAQFVDDSATTAQNFNQVTEILNTLRCYTEPLGYKLTKIKIAANRKAIAEHGSKTFKWWSHKGELLQQMEIKDHIAVLGACVHLDKEKEDSEHARIKCAHCKMKSVNPLCEKCTNKTLKMLLEWKGAAPTEKIALVKMFFLPAVDYMEFSCQHRHDFKSSFLDKMRQYVHLSYGANGQGNSGYREWMYMPAKEGGLGVPDPDVDSRIKLCCILEREIANNNPQGRKIQYWLRYRANTGANLWPPVIQYIMGKQIVFELREKPDKSNDKEKQLMLVRILVERKKPVGVDKTQRYVVHYTSIHSRGGEEFQGSLDATGLANSEIPLWAIGLVAFERRKEKLQIFMEASDRISAEVKKYKSQTIKERLENTHRCTLEHLARADITVKPLREAPKEMGTAPQQMQFGGSLKNRCGNMTLLPFKVVWGNTHIKGPLKREMKKIHLDYLKREIPKLTQMRNLLQGIRPEWRLSGVALALKQTGVAMESELTPQESRMLLALRTGAALKTDKEWKCQWKAKAEEILCGEQTTFRHILQHISMEEHEDDRNKAEAISRANELHNVLWPLPWERVDSKENICLHLGFFPEDFKIFLEDKNWKGHCAAIAKITTIFAKRYIAAASKSILGYCVSTSVKKEIARRESLNKEIVQREQKEKLHIRITTDAGFDQGTKSISIGIVIWEGKNKLAFLGRKIEQAELVVEDQGITPGATTGEYLAQIEGLRFLKKILNCVRWKYEPLIRTNEIGMDSDSDASIEQAQGNWHCNLEILHLKTKLLQEMGGVEKPFNIKMKRKWIPRTENAEADYYAGIGMTTEGVAWIQEDIRKLAPQLENLMKRAQEETQHGSLDRRECFVRTEKPKITLIKRTPTVTTEGEQLPQWCRVGQKVVTRFANGEPVIWTIKEVEEDGSVIIKGEDELLLRFSYKDLIPHTPQEIQQ